jgi:ATP-binding cassette subfamily F protein uup
LALLLNVQGLEKSFGSTTLFRGISFTISDGDRIGLIGPNGSGKSTLMQTLAGIVAPDAGDVAIRKRAKLGYVAQDSQFAPGESVNQVINGALEAVHAPELERDARREETLGRAGFVDVEQEAAKLSGGWRKRLAIAEALVAAPDILLLDEPTNHLDLAGIEWLEELLLDSSFAAVIVSHDRYFLENVATVMAELNRAYPDGMLRVTGNYSTFLEKKGEYLHAQAKHQDALENRVKTEMEWLRRGPKARTTKSKSRIAKAHEMIGELKDLNSRMRTSTADIDFTASDRRTKRLVEIEGLSQTFDSRRLFDNLNFVITAGMRVGLVGPNGGGKTTLLRLLRGEYTPQTGTIKRAEQLRVVYFDQNRTLDGKQTLRRALAPDGDSVIYQDRVIHVASWASRFLFANDQLNQPVESLSGGERARVLIARLMLEPADLLLLDEPTNDLDIPTLEILEESLLEFPGALVLVTHDRYLLDRVSTIVLGLDGEGHTEAFADFSQWDVWQKSDRTPVRAPAPNAPALPPPAASSAPKKKLSYKDQRDYETIEARIAEAEQLLEAKKAALEDPAIVTNPTALQQALKDVETAQLAAEELFMRWAELEAKLG